VDKPDGTDARPLIQWRDLKRVAVLCTGYLIPGLLPASLQRRIGALAAPAFLRWRPSRIRRVASRMQAVLGSPPGDASFESLARTYCEGVLQDQWLRLCALHGARLPVNTTVDGLEALHAALAQGRGVILWGMSFCGTLLAKVALHRAGVRLVHLSNAEHGVPSPATRVGLRLAGPLYCIPENRYIGRRVIIPADGPLLGSMKALQASLERNECVWIAGERVARRQNVEADLFGRRIRFAPGAAALAWAQEATLLSVYAVRDYPFGYRVVIEPPILAGRGLAKREFVHAAVQEFARRIGRHVLERPADWDWDDHTVRQYLSEEV
jgi:lauroyl/myristoyl acyltransferase